MLLLIVGAVMVGVVALFLQDHDKNRIGDPLLLLAVGMLVVGVALIVVRAV